MVKKICQIVIVMQTMQDLEPLAGIEVTLYRNFGPSTENVYRGKLIKSASGEFAVEFKDHDGLTYLTVEDGDRLQIEIEYKIFSDAIRAQIQTGLKSSSPIT